MRYNALIFVTFLSVTAGSARADWGVRVDGPDVFGDTTVVAVSEGQKGNFVIQCNQTDQLDVAYTIKKKEFDTVEARPADLLVQVDGGRPTKLPAILDNWNDNYIGIAVKDRSPDLVALIRAIGNAKHAINIGILVGSIRESDTFEAVGSTHAMTQVIQGCKLDNINEE